MGKGRLQKTGVEAIGSEAVILGPKASYQKGASVFTKALLLQKALVRGGFGKTCFGAIGPKAVIIGPKANHPKGASVFNRTLLLKKAWVKGGCKKQVLRLSARRLLS